MNICRAVSFFTAPTVCLVLTTLEASVLSPQKRTPTRNHQSEPQQANIASFLLDVNESPRFFGYGNLHHLSNFRSPVGGHGLSRSGVPRLDLGYFLRDLCLLNCHFSFFSQLHFFQVLSFSPYRNFDTSIATHARTSGNKFTNDDILLKPN